MINKLIKSELRKTKISRYRISKETGISEGILSKIYNENQAGLSAKNAGKLLEFFGYQITKKEGGK